MDKIVNIQNLDPTTLELQTYSTDDQNLISSFDLENSFTSSVDYIEYSIYDINQNLLLYINNFTNYSLLNNVLQINPEQDLNLYGFDEGQYITNYSFLKNILGSTQNNRYYISEISSDRTEIRLDTNLISNDIVINQTNNYKIQLEQSQYYKDFYLNFSNNDLVIANNVLLDNSNPDNPTVLIKLYEPLPTQFDLKSELWVVETISDPLTYQIDITLIFNNLDNNIQLNGPNFNIPIKDRINNSTEFVNFNSLNNTTSQYGTSSLQYQLNSILNEKGFEINIDYNDYSNFIFFSSAQTRLENFYYKMSLIEEYSRLSNQNITGSATGSYYVSSSFDIYQTKINDIITKFDGYEYFLYYESGSKSWPKTNVDIPYINASTGSASVQSWLTLQYTSASYYDNDLNPNNLINTIPSYLRDDPDNSQYILFVEMIGQHFDSIWVYIKDITNKYNADNRLDYGVSKDLISDVLKDLGIKIYQNNFSTDDLYSAFLGITPGGSLVPPTGSELITNYISASFNPYVLPGYVITDYVNGQPIVVPLADVNASIYKRIYHNVPYLFKKKGTVEGLRALITLYGIPDTILRINEFGGKNKDNSNDWDQWQNQFDYAFDTEGTNFISSSFVLNSSWSSSNGVPNAVEFKFNSNQLPTSDITQTLISADSTLVLTLDYAVIPTSSYSGSTTDPYYEYGTLTLYPNISDLNNTASIYLPFYNNGWWSVLLNYDANTSDITLVAKNYLYNGEDGNQIGFQSSSSVTDVSNEWEQSTVIYFGYDSAQTYDNYDGLLQEIRYYTRPLSQSIFDDYVMNPYSIESNEYLAFRAPLGGELYLNSSSIHPKVTGSWVATSSFVSNSNFSFDVTPTFTSFVPNTNTIFLDQPLAGIRNIVNNKIKIAQTILPSGDTLSPYIRTQQELPVSGSYTKDLNLLEVALSPQNEINQDIINQLGFFNIGEFIGDPRQLISTNTSYPDLDTLRNEYFSKYTHNYNLTDYVRLIKYFDNSLFKMIKDFVPARTSLSSGIVIKQHLLERNRYRVPSSSYSEPYYTASVQSFPYGFYTGSIFIDAISSSYSGSPVVLLTTSSRELASDPLTYTFTQNYDLVYISGSFINNTGTGNLVRVVYYNPSYNELYIDSPSAVPGTTSSFFLSQSFNSSDQLSFSSDALLAGETLDVSIYTTGSIIYNTVQSSASSRHYFTQLYKTEGGSAGVYNNLSTSPLTQSWVENILTPLGMTTQVHNDKSEFLTGELSGSNIVVTTQSLGPTPLPFELELIKVISGFSLVTSYDIPFEFKSDKVYYIQLNIDNTDTIFSADVYAFWFGTNPLDIVYENNNILPLTSVSPFIKIENAKTSVLRIVNASLFVSPDVSILIFEAPLSLPNPLLNNAISTRPSTKYLDIDYSSGQFIPVNQQAILSGSATKAITQDYNWNVRRSTLPRYDGSKLTGAQINEYNIGDISYGKEPVIESYTDIFAYFEWIGNASPEIFNAGNVNITKLVKSDSTVIPLQSLPLGQRVTGSSNLFTVETLFKPGDNVKLYDLSSSINNLLPASSNIIDAGGYYDTALYFSGSITDIRFYENLISYSNPKPYWKINTSSEFQFVPNQLFTWTNKTWEEDSLINVLSIAGFTKPSLSVIFYDNPSTYSDVEFQFNTNYFPLEKYDIVRIVTSSASFAESNLNYEQRQINTVNTSSTSYTLYSPFSNILSSTGAVTGSYAIRLMKKLHREDFVIISNISSSVITQGLLVPQNYNPTLDPLEIARKANLI